MYKKLSLFILLVLFVISTGCSNKSKFEPLVNQVVNNVEIFSSYDPLTFLKDSSNDHYIIEVEKDDIDINQIGAYNVTYKISSSDKKKSVTRSYILNVVDSTAPSLVIANEISLEQYTNFNIEDYASAEDNVDGNVSNKITFEGDLDTSTVGTYQITVMVTDSSENLAKKQVNIYIEKNSETAGGVNGEYYVNYDNDGTSNPTLVLNKDNTFILKINYCSGFGTYNGTYDVNGGVVTLTSDGLTFDDDPASSTVSLDVNPDGSLTYRNSYSACSPIKNDIFYRK